MQNRIAQVFLDLDGVIRDWDAGVMAQYGITYRKTDVQSWNHIPEVICRAEGITEAEFWNRQDDAFWENLPFTSEAREILALMEEMESTGLNITLLTSPTMTSAGGNQKWIRKHLPEYFGPKHYLIGPDKAACAHPGALLIDDADKNHYAFLRAGGNSILIPRPYNSNCKINDPVNYLTRELQALGLV
jgi:hypothetical protein